MSSVPVDDPQARYARAVSKANPIDPEWATRFVTTDSWNSRISKGALGDPVPGVIGPCWIWIGSINISGYGTFGVNRKSIAAHRISLVAKLGRDIEPGKIAGHVCHDLAVEYGSCQPFRKELGPCYHRRCVNPNHLEEMVPKENAYTRRNRSYLQGLKPPEL